MRKSKRSFENYEEIALDLRTARELLLWTTHIFKRAPYTDAISKICKRVDSLSVKQKMKCLMIGQREQVPRCFTVEMIIT